MKLREAPLRMTDLIFIKHLLALYMSIQPREFQSQLRKCNRNGSPLVVSVARGDTPMLEEAMVSSGMTLFLGEIGDFRTAGAICLFLFLSVLMISIFTFVSIAVWTDARRQEREAYYKSESMRRIAETPGDGAKYVIEIMREEERIRQANERAREIKKIQGMKIGGVVNIAVGLGLMVFLYFLIDKGDKPAYLVGLIPAFIGLALLISVNFLTPKFPLQ
jgi:hypothetical protein